MKFYQFYISFLVQSVEEIVCKSVAATFLRKFSLKLLRKLTLHNNKYQFKGSVKWKKRGGMSGISQCAFNLSTFPQILYRFLKDPGPLNNKKRISAA